MSQAKHKGKLQQLLNFTTEDLEANRAGYMTFHQENQLRLEGIAQSGWFVLVFLLLVAPFIWMYLTDSASVDLPFFCFFAMLTPFIVVVIILCQLEWHNYHVDLQKKEIRLVQGLVNVDRLGNKHRLHVGEEIFNIPRYLYAEFETLLATQAEWLIYYAPKSRTILSLEVLATKPMSNP